jgi:Uma2 family endonuclease
MVIPSVDIQVEERVREIVFLLMQRPITQEIALQVGDIDGFKHLEIVNGDWLGFEQDEYMTGEEHGWIETKLILAFGNFIVQNNLGRLYPGDMDFVLSGNKDTLKDKLQPDIAFVKKDRLQKTAGYFYGTPDFALEIVSPINIVQNQ